MADQLVQAVQAEAKRDNGDPKDREVVTTTYTYDANGNRVGRVRVEEAGDDGEAHETAYRYDRENRLVEVTKADRDDDENPEAEVVLLAYDGLGRRLVRERVEEGHDEDYDEATRIEYLFDGVAASGPTGAKWSERCRSAYLPANLERLVRYYARVYGIPWQVLAGLLQSEIRLDTNWMDTVENLLLRALYINTHFNYFDRNSRMVSWLLLRAVLVVKPNPGPGVGNVHVETARKISRYFYENYPEERNMQLNLHDLPTEEVAFWLTFDEVNVKVVAAYTRMLADYRFGERGEPKKKPHEDLAEWALEDALVIWHGYRYGVEEVSPRSERYGWSLPDFQNRSVTLEELLNLAQGPGAKESIRGAVPFFRCYMRCP